MGFQIKKYKWWTWWFYKHFSFELWNVIFMALINIPGMALDSQSGNIEGGRLCDEKACLSPEAQWQAGESSNLIKELSPLVGSCQRCRWRSSALGIWVSDTWHWTEKLCGVSLQTGNGGRVTLGRTMGRREEHFGVVHSSVWVALGRHQDWGKEQLWGK